MHKVELKARYISYHSQVCFTSCTSNYIDGKPEGKMASYAINGDIATIEFWSSNTTYKQPYMDPKASILVIGSDLLASVAHRSSEAYLRF